MDVFGSGRARWAVGIEGLAVRGAMSGVELDTELERNEADRAVLKRHRATLAPPAEDEQLDVGLLSQLRAKLEAGLSDQQRHEIVRLLVGHISVTTTIEDGGGKEAPAGI